MWFLKNPGVLGINARNLLYIKPYNPEQAINFADSKLKTKQFLAARGIPVAKLYATILSKQELKHFDWDVLPGSFVLKPNAGYGGEGIVVTLERRQDAWLKPDGSLITLDQLQRHVSDILDGRYSITGLSDKALFEKRLESGPPLSEMAYLGLPDIRVIVHNLIPVMAMLRLPTQESEGKANVHLGGIGVGIDMGKGETTYATQYNKIIDDIPDYGPARGIKIPHWKDILLIASRIQQITNLGFAAVDIALDKTLGPVLLEINARAGLMVQIANRAPLRRRLERIKGIRVGTPEKGVRMAQDLFGHVLEYASSHRRSKVIIGPLERVELLGTQNNRTVLAHIDPFLEKTRVDERVAAEIGIEEDLKLKLVLGGMRLRTVVETGDFSAETYQMKIGKRDLGNFLIDPSRTQSHLSVPNLVHSLTEQERQEIDRTICEIDARIHLLAHLRPLNLNEEQERFLANPLHNPQFIYPSYDLDFKVIRQRLSHLLFSDDAMGVLWAKKCDEMERKLALLEARGDAREFTQRSIALYGFPDDDMVAQALQQIRGIPSSFPLEEETVNAGEAQRIFKQVLADYGLTRWEVELKEGIVADAIAGKEGVIFIRAGALFSYQRLQGMIAHEIETHVFTAENGRAQPYRLFQRGLADYLATEEGLAVYNQDRTEASETEKKYWPASSVIGIEVARKESFAHVYQTVLELGFSRERAWKVALKAKRGLSDTALPGCFTKDGVYFKGHRMILEFIQRGGDPKELYYGKINLNDLSLVKKIDHLKQPIFLPDYLR